MYAYIVNKNLTTTYFFYKEQVVYLTTQTYCVFPSCTAASHNLSVASDKWASMTAR